MQRNTDQLNNRSRHHQIHGSWEVYGFRRPCPIPGFLALLRSPCDNNGPWVPAFNNKRIVHTCMTNNRRYALKKRCASVACTPERKFVGVRLRGQEDRLLSLAGELQSFLVSDTSDIRDKVDEKGGSACTVASGFIRFLPEVGSMSSCVAASLSIRFFGGAMIELLLEL
ncbi:hypothetical protein CLAIMM_14464 [Cladophialophora immunda]|nr:hypothetical protein CLAIMM_14464 [Cladophialophora immunda]